MPTTREDICCWFNHALQQDATHMIVATDTFDWSDYPVFVGRDADVASEIERLRKQEMTMITEVYNMTLPLEGQLAERRAFHL